MQAINTTLCYIEQNGCYLMLHRVKKQDDLNRGKWIGVGGKFEPDESPDECLLREVREETSLRLTSYRFRGLVTFVCVNAPTEYMHLFTADRFDGEVGECSEGELAWIEKSRVPQLNLWEGDRVFLRLLEEKTEFFLLKLVYDDEQRLVRVLLNGREQPLPQ